MPSCPGAVRYRVGADERPVPFHCFRRRRKNGRSHRFKGRNAGSGRHVQSLEHGTCFLIDMANVTAGVFPRAVPKFTVDPGATGDEPIGFDRAQHFSGLGIHLMYLAAAMLSDPERSLCPRQAGFPPSPGAVSFTPDEVAAAKSITTSANGAKPAVSGWVSAPSTRMRRARSSAPTPPMDAASK